MAAVLKAVHVRRGEGEEGLMLTHEHKIIMMRPIVSRLGVHNHPVDRLERHYGLALVRILVAHSRRDAWFEDAGSDRRADESDLEGIESETLRSVCLSSSVGAGWHVSTTAPTSEPASMSRSSALTLVFLPITAMAMGMDCSGTVTTACAACSMMGCIGSTV